MSPVSFPHLLIILVTGLFVSLSLALPSTAIGFSRRTNDSAISIPSNQGWDQEFTRTFRYLRDVFGPAQIDRSRIIALDAGDVDGLGDVNQGIVTLTMIDDVTHQIYIGVNENAGATFQHAQVDPSQPASPFAWALDRDGNFDWPIDVHGLTVEHAMTIARPIANAHGLSAHPFEWCTLSAFDFGSPTDDVLFIFRFGGEDIGRDPAVIIDADTLEARFFDDLPLEPEEGITIPEEGKVSDSPAHMLMANATESPAVVSGIARIPAIPKESLVAVA